MVIVTVACICWLAVLILLNVTEALHVTLVADRLSFGLRIGQADPLDDGLGL